MTSPTPTPGSVNIVEVGLGAVVVGGGFGGQIFGFDSGSPRLLVARRPAGTVMAGWWELPGGKVHLDERPSECVVRELSEELGVVGEAVEAFPEVVHTYAHATVRLHPWLCRLAPGSPEPRNLAVAEHRWATADELDGFEFLPANGPILAAIVERMRRGA